MTPPGAPAPEDADPIENGGCRVEEEVPEWDWDPEGEDESTANTDSNRGAEDKCEADAA